MVLGGYRSCCWWYGSGPCTHIIDTSPPPKKTNHTCTKRLQHVHGPLRLVAVAVVAAAAAALFPPAPPTKVLLLPLPQHFYLGVDILALRFAFLGPSGCELWNLGTGLSAPSTQRAQHSKIKCYYTLNNRNLRIVDYGVCMCAYK